MKIYMKATMKGSEDGIKIKLFPCGDVIDTTEELAKIYVEDLKVAEYYKEPKKEEPKPEIKKEVVPENKMVKVEEDKELPKEEPKKEYKPYKKRKKDNEK